MVIMALYLCFAAGLVVSMVMKVIRANRERNEQLSILTSMSGMYYSMHMLDLQNDTFALYTAGDLILRAGERAAGAKELMREIAHKVVVDEYQASAQKFMDLDSLEDRLVKMRKRRLLTETNLFSKRSFRYRRANARAELLIALLHY